MAERFTQKPVRVTPTGKRHPLVEVCMVCGDPREAHTPAELATGCKRKSHD